MLNLLPPRVVTFPTGADLTFTNAALFASVDVNDTFVNIGPASPAVGTSVLGFISPATTNANDSVIRRYPVGGPPASGTASVTRTATRPPGALVITYAGSATAFIARPVAEFAAVGSSVGDQYVANLPVTFDVVSPACSGRITMFALNGTGALTLTAGVTARLAVGGYEVSYSDGVVFERNVFTGVNTGTPSASLACSLEFRAAP